MAVCVMQSAKQIIYTMFFYTFHFVCGLMSRSGPLQLGFQSSSGVGYRHGLGSFTDFGEEEPDYQRDTMFVVGYLWTALAIHRTYLQYQGLVGFVDAFRNSP